MKQLLLSLLIFLFIAMPVMAITPAQLEQAEETLRQMDGKISVLRGYVQTARNQKIGFIDLTSEQIQQIKDKYLAEKSELVDLYNQLP